ncbi:CTNNA1 isoform 36 [Pongo abelii]|uniref:CTNNA1 isoform 36 n=3 Tax=Catarrhini TaxID=9526 RepID=A0A2J8VPQ6_PONAB|nr:CTNNA1 isoform 36 [Pongo abelii]
MTAVHAGNINFKWDPKSLEIRTLAVERLLEPLVTQILHLSLEGKPKKGGIWILDC